ncbi:FGGY-family carbohydrate kinase [Planktothrix sp. FACHB-1355]|uniref:D-ribulose kinase n=1 Tax=Aerosakkonema funiforme FACHB-1375 TaxID=2949571 RepID=A0A926VMA3_9CYAN|nr:MULTISPECIES: FGGY-family carbohydrate kinase [Oscillatoriales]MBD2185778.1 FGGY-family carbohydrate kinase [Aerosakkonema funiforme FACHB-1375]MBD3559486.1 FGGY-family carbohydrate kinase [Planktothrix sp. FACHB-1355]
MELYLGIDFGTSGARAIAINREGIIQSETQYAFDESQAGTPAPQDNSAPQDNLAKIWQQALFFLIQEIPSQVRSQIKAISINGTSSTVLLCDTAGNPIDEPILYNDARGIEVMDKVREIAPPNHTVISATSSLAKLLWWTQQPVFANAKYFLHQADWLAFLLHRRLGITDYHNALKLGYDVEQLCYPKWLENLEISIQLPSVIAPGTPICEVTTEIANNLGLKRNCVVCAGTTDSIAAFLASGATSPGEASTSLGSTLVIKLLSSTRVDDAKYGIYSHRLGNLWLVGGASNTGGAVLRQFFTDTELENLSREIDAKKESLLDYYPLLKAGDRFPINDPNLPPRLEPRPENPVEFLHGLLASIARIETRGYQLLQQFGATPLTRVYTAGGGAKNPTWTKIRHRYLQVPILPPVNTAAAYGTALLAMRGVSN